ncbi:MAG: acyl-CoA thioesterase [Deltaproteobacteria bacterium]|nr:acyl-CoA thioesterase [Deltaproteobacteria bacterium]
MRIHQSKVRVLFADTDAMGVVYHTNYIKWFEIGRAELFRDLGLLYSHMEASGFNLPLTQAFCHYFISARYDQLLLIETELVYVKRVSLKFQYIIWDEGRQTVLARGYTVHGCTDREGRIARIPEEFSRKLQQDY